MPIPALPLEMNGERFGMRLDIPQAGEHSAAIATELGCSADEIRALVEEGVLGVSSAPLAGTGQGRRSGVGVTRTAKS